MAGYIGNRRQNNLVSLDGATGTIGDNVVFPAGHIIQTFHAYQSVSTSSALGDEPINLVNVTTGTFSNTSNYLLVYCLGQYSRTNGNEADYYVSLKLATGGTVTGKTVSGHTVYSTEGNILTNSGGSTVNSQFIAYSRVFKYQLSSTSALTFRIILEDSSGANAMYSNNSIVIFEVKA